MTTLLNKTFVLKSKEHSTTLTVVQLDSKIGRIRRPSVINSTGRVVGMVIPLSTLFSPYTYCNIEAGVITLKITVYANYGDNPKVYYTNGKRAGQAYLIATGGSIDTLTQPHWVYMVMLDKYNVYKPTVESLRGRP